MTDNFKDIITEDNLILAGTKVVDKAGGPLMVIVSFSSVTSEVINQKYKPKIFGRQKVFVNREGKTIRELSNGRVSNDKKYTYFFFTDIFSEIETSYRSPADLLFIICKYWSDTENDFIYVNKTLPEIEKVL